MTRVAWSAPANADLESIDDYWAAYSLTAADNIAGKLERAATFLSTTPRAGQRIAHSRLRKWSVVTTHYILIYRVENDTIQVLRVFHHSQDWAAQDWPAQDRDEP